MKIFSGLLLATVTISAPASAAVYTINLSGVVENVYWGNAPSLDPSTIPFALGDAWSASYTIDDAAADNSSNPSAGVYATGGFSGSVGTYSFSTPDSYTGVMNDFSDLVPPYATYDLIYANWRNDQAQNFSLSLFDISLYDPTASAFSSDALAANIFNLALYSLTNSNITIAFSDSKAGEYYNASLGISSLTVTPLETPLPAALPMFLSGIAGFGAWGWRRRKAKA